MGWHGQPSTDGSLLLIFYRALVFFIGSKGRKTVRIVKSLPSSHVLKGESRRLETT